MKAKNSINKKWYNQLSLKSFKLFYKDESLLKSYKNLLSLIQTSFSKEKNVIGIDVLNEPFPAIPFPLFFERAFLSKFYSEIGYESQKIPFFYEPPIWCNSGIPSNLGEELHIANKKYIPHYYPPLVKYSGQYSKIDKVLLKFAIRSKAREAQKMNSPFFIGEIGISSKIKNKFNLIKDFIDIADKYYLNWVWWCYDKDSYSRHGLIGNYGKPNNIMESLSRPYPQSIAGTDPYYYNDGENFYIEYTCNDTYKVPTEIFIPGKVFDIETNTTIVPYTDNSEKKGNVLKFYTKIFGKQKIKIKWMSS